MDIEAPCQPINQWRGGGLGRGSGACIKQSQNTFAEINKTRRRMTSDEAVLSGAVLCGAVYVYYGLVCIPNTAEPILIDRIS